MTEKINASGQCLCGAISIEVTGAEREIHACHCSMCRRWNGGAPGFATQVDSVTFNGEENLGRFESSAWAERGFCKACGSSLFYLLKPDTYIMNVGCFDDPDVFELHGEIFCADKPSMYALAGDHPRHAQMP